MQQKLIKDFPKKKTYEEKARQEPYEILYKIVSNILPKQKSIGLTIS